MGLKQCDLSAGNKLRGAKLARKALNHGQRNKSQALRDMQI
jgi:hypothetical protein